MINNCSELCHLADILVLVLETGNEALDELVPLLEEGVHVCVVLHQVTQQAASARLHRRGVVLHQQGQLVWAAYTRKIVKVFKSFLTLSIHSSQSDVRLSGLATHGSVKIGIHFFLHLDYLTYICITVTVTSTCLFLCKEIGIVSERMCIFVLTISNNSMVRIVNYSKKTKKKQH